MHNWIILLYTWNNVNQLYFNFKKNSFSKEMEMKVYWEPNKHKVIKKKSLLYTPKSGHSGWESFTVAQSKCKSHGPLDGCEFCGIRAPGVTTYDDLFL